MADGTLGIFHAPEAAYSTKPNIRYPGTAAQVTAAAAKAVVVVNDRLAPGVTISGLTPIISN